MNPLPRTGSYLVDSMLFAVGAICFTLAVGLVVIVGALIIQATMLVSEPYVGSRSAASVLAIVVFATYVGVPSYLIATYADDPEGQDAAADPDAATDPDAAADPDDAADRREQAADDRTVTADLDEPRPGAARCDGARPEGEHSDRQDGEGP